MMTFAGKADLSIIENVKPESRKTGKSLLFFIVPMLSAVQIAIGHSFLGKIIFGP